MYRRGGYYAVRHRQITTCVVEWYHPKYGTPTVAAAICRQPARRAGVVVHLCLYRPTGPAPRRGWMALGQRRYICTVYRVVPFTDTGYYCYVFDILRTQNDGRYVKYTVIRNKCIVVEC